MPSCREAARRLACHLGKTGETPIPQEIVGAGQRHKYTINSEGCLLEFNRYEFISGNISVWQTERFKKDARSSLK